MSLYLDERYSEQRQLVFRTANGSMQLRRRIIVHAVWNSYYYPCECIEFCGPKDSGFNGRQSEFEKCVANEGVLAQW